MACPHVTGLVALLLEAAGPLSKRELLERMAHHARADAFTGAVPNPAWGTGKIDAFSAISQPTPILVTGLSVTRRLDSIELSWSVPGDVSDLRFLIERTQGEAARTTTSRWGQRNIFVGEVGPGPDYHYVDGPLLEHENVAYWLVPLESGRERTSLGPFAARWGEVPLQYAFAPPAPNPFRTETRVRLDLPAAGRVDVEVIDAAGRRVRRLAGGTLPAGALTVSWNGRDDRGGRSPNGIYWIRGMWNGERRSARVLFLGDR
jgi:hypothetical protein